MATVAQPTVDSTDDIGLVAAVRAGDDRAFEQLYVRYHSRISAYVRGMVRDHGRAEDITQDVFISALRRMRETDREIVFKPWIYEIAKNACIDAFRRTRNRHEVSFDAEDALEPGDYGRLASPGSAPDVLVDTKLALNDLCGAFGGLSQTHHDILVMREFEGLSYREIGDRLGMSRAAVESTLFRARRRLGEEYEELVSGKRCVRVRGIVDAPPGQVVGLRDQRRMARHISHCQPCRRYACLAGVDLEAVRPLVGARIAALLPLPAFVRRRLDSEEAASLLGTHVARAQSWSSNALSMLDPAAVSGWSKAVAAAATIAVAGLGAGAAVGDRAGVADRGPLSRGILGLAPDRSKSDEGSVSLSSLAPVLSAVQGAAPGAGTAGRPGQPGAGALQRGGGGAAGSAPAAAGTAGSSTGTRPESSALGNVTTGLGVPAPGSGRTLDVTGGRAAPETLVEPRRPVTSLLEAVGVGGGDTAGGGTERKPKLPVVGGVAPSLVGAGGPSTGATGGLPGTGVVGGVVEGGTGSGVPELPAPLVKDRPRVTDVVGGMLDTVGVAGR